MGNTVILTKHIARKITTKEQDFVKKLLIKRPKVKDCIKERDVSSLVKLTNDIGSLDMESFIKVLVRTDVQFANEYLSAVINLNEDLFLAELVINKIITNTNISRFMITDCLIDELELDLSDYLNNERISAKLPYILGISNSDINTIKVKVRPGISYDRVKIGIKDSLRRRYSTVQNIIVTME